jgi:hypothetical protein
VCSDLFKWLKFRALKIAHCPSRKIFPDMCHGVKFLKIAVKSAENNHQQIQKNVTKNYSTKISVKQWGIPIGDPIIGSQLQKKFASHFQ